MVFSYDNDKKICMVASDCLDMETNPLQGDCLVARIFCFR